MRQLRVGLLALASRSSPVATSSTAAVGIRLPWPSRLARIQFGAQPLDAVGVAIGLEVHRDFCEVTVNNDDEVRRVATRPAALALFAQSLVVGNLGPWP
jgi:hypothetical protein